VLRPRRELRQFAAYVNLGGLDERDPRAHERPDQGEALDKPTG